MSKILIAAAAFSAILGGQALASDAKTAAVPLAGVNFNDRADVQTLYRQINVAAEKVCAIDSTNKYIAHSDRVCVDRAVAAAVRNANRPLLTAAAAQSTPALRALANNDQ